VRDSSVENEAYLDTPFTSEPEPVWRRTIRVHLCFWLKFPSKVARSPRIIRRLCNVQFFCERCHILHRACFVMVTVSDVINVRWKSRRSNAHTVHCILSSIKIFFLNLRCWHSLHAMLTIIMFIIVETSRCETMHSFLKLRLRKMQNIKVIFDTLNIKLSFRFISLLEMRMKTTWIAKVVEARIFFQ
jgi:hypothetical protein